MRKPPHVMEIYLQPGEVWVGDRNTRIRTILGSCVAITLWHPKHLIGGMCHYMLAQRGHSRTPRPDGRYADEAMEILVKEARKAGCRPEQMEAKLFGGGRMFEPVRSGRQGAHRVQDRNIEAGRALVAKFGARLVAEHLGGHGRRQLLFDVWSGHIWMKHTPLPGQGAGDEETLAS